MKYFAGMLMTFILFACAGPEARRPVKVSSGSFIKESVERNKELLAREEKIIQDLISKDSLNSYHASSTGSWYYYSVTNDSDDYTPRPNDRVTLTYNIISLQNDTIYTTGDIGTVQYLVDQQELFPGLRNGVKLLKEKETATFLFPSSLAYGYHGDNNKIGANVPIKSTLTILGIEKRKDSIIN